MTIASAIENSAGKFCILLLKENPATLRTEKEVPSMGTQSVTVTFSTEAGSRTLADCLEQLLSNLNLEATEGDNL